MAQSPSKRSLITACDHSTEVYLNRLAVRESWGFLVAQFGVKLY
jgi:hypothetical protein